MQIPWPVIQLDKLFHRPLMAIEILSTPPPAPSAGTLSPTQTEQISWNTSGNLDGSFEPWVLLNYMHSLGFLSRTHTRDKTWTLEMCTLAQSSPRASQVHLYKGGIRSFEDSSQTGSCLAPSLALPFPPRARPVPLLSRCTSPPILVSVNSDGSSFCCLFKSQFPVCKILTSAPRGPREEAGQ